MSEYRTYESRGVSAGKEDVKGLLRFVDPGIFPGAFCKAVPDIIGGSPEHCFLLHADGAGTKAALAYISYRRHRDPSIFSGIAQDAMVMNLDDLLCVGCTGPFVLSNTIGRNAKLIPVEVIEAIVSGYEATAAQVGRYGIDILPCGGETADVGDLVRTIVVDATMAARMRREDFIDCSRVKQGQIIIGFASFGQAEWETSYNSGIGTNGFTAARHELLRRTFRDEFPETYAPEIANLAYMGQFDIDDPLPDTAMTIGEALLCPTRTYAPILRDVLGGYRGEISGIFHNSGGGQTKCLAFGSNVRYVKDNLFPLPPVFRFIRDATGLPLREMSRVFNLGHRMEVVCDASVCQEIVEIASGMKVEARVVGRVEREVGARSLILSVEGETIEFT